MKPNHETGGITFETGQEVKMAAAALRFTGFERLSKTINVSDEMLDLPPLESDLVIQGLKKIVPKNPPLNSVQREAAKMLTDYMTLRVDIEI